MKSRKPLLFFLLLLSFFFFACTSDGQDVAGVIAPFADDASLESTAQGDNAADSISNQPICYFPCKQSIFKADTGVSIECSSDGLMQYCPDNTQCRCPQGVSCDFGRCLHPEAEYASCQQDYDCAIFEHCSLEGYCRSNCVTNDDCRSGADSGETLCYMQVCRTPCQIGADDCPQGEVCISQGENSAICLPKVPRSQLARAQELQNDVAISGNFDIRPSLLVLSGMDGNSSFTLTNNSSQTQQFTIRKIVHSTYTANDDLEQKLFNYHDPLSWLNIDGKADQEIVITVDPINPSGSHVKEIALTNLIPICPPLWEGTISISNDSMGSRDLRIMYNSGAEGQWKGKAYYFADFNDAGLAEWIADRKDFKKRSQVKNAFMQKWFQLLEQDMIGEFMYMLKAVTSGSWTYKSVRDRCRQELTEEVCYLIEDGVVALTTDQTTNPVPQGVFSLPMVINLERQDGDNSGKKFVGRIDSSGALQYFGNPRLRLEFDSAASNVRYSVCATQPDNPICKHPLRVLQMAKLDASIVVGGRYFPDANDIDFSALTSADFSLGYKSDVNGKYCTTNVNVSNLLDPYLPSFVLSRTPWLLPGFTMGTQADMAGERYLYECRDQRRPFTQGSGLSGVNASFALANPIPNGISRVRQLELVDGALLNQEYLYIIFKESFDSFIPDTKEPLVRFGVMELARGDNTIKRSEFKGNDQDDQRHLPSNIELVSCSSAVLNAIHQEDEINNVHQAANAQGMLHKTIQTLIEGVTPEQVQNLIDVNATTETESVHYYCEDSGLIDGGSSGGLNIVNNGSATAQISTGRIACPPGSKVMFFVLDSNDFSANQLSDQNLSSTADLSPLSCQLDYQRGEQCIINRDTTGDNQGGIADENACWYSITRKGSCQSVLDGWLRDRKARIPQWRCENADRVACEYDEVKDPMRLDLTQGKVFFKKPPIGQIETGWLQFDNAIKNAFVYRTQFRNRFTGGSVGFAPIICEPGIRYCYDPDEIEIAEQRFDCLLDAYHNYYDKTWNDQSDDFRGIYQPSSSSVDAQTLYDQDKRKIRELLQRNFAFYENDNTGFAEDGFERLYVELLIMLGDDKYTASFASRFDLAGSNMKSFEGALFEPNGINLSGGAGYEMYNLYQAAQYYQKALDRFYSLSSHLGQAVNAQSTDFNYIGLDAVVSYFDRLVRASTQKSRTWSEIAKRYQDFNRPDLARSVIERAYNASYLESIAFSEVMKQVAGKISPQQKDQFDKILSMAQLRYETALLEMRDGYSDIKDEITYFGYAPDYIPFPALDDGDGNAFKKLMAASWQKTVVAADKERLALQDSRSYETDSASFQTELTRIRINYENQLAEICGSMENESNDEDYQVFGDVVPAISKYKHLNANANQIDDPCGVMGNGSIHEAVQEMEIASVEARKVTRAMDNVITAVQIEKERVELACQFLTADATDQCNIALNRTDRSCKRMLAKMTTTMDKTEDVDALNHTIRAAEFTKAQAVRALDLVDQMGDKSSCLVIAGVAAGTDCPAKIVAAASFSTAWAVSNATQLAMEATILGSQTAIQALERDKMEWEMSAECGGPEYWDKKAACEAITVKNSCTDDTRCMWNPYYNGNRGKCVVNSAASDNALNECENIYAGDSAPCDMANADSAAKIKTMLLDLRTMELDLLKAQYGIMLIQSRVEKLRNQAKRIANEQAEMEQLLIDVEAARNNPNIRIYKNDAIINADRAFERAIRSAYNTSKIFEYYTSQAYEALNSLMLVRMIAYGDISLENYLNDLQDQYSEFEEQFGNPDTRVAIISLRNDIWGDQISDYQVNMQDGDTSVAPKSLKDKTNEFRNLLLDRRWRDDQGHIVISFNTNYVKKISPVTGNHKIKFVEMEIIGSNLGDKSARLYLRQSGVGKILSLSGENLLYSFPPRMAVVNPYFNGQRHLVFATDEVFTNKKLMDRPLLNSQYELVINMIDEEVNKDIDLASIDDIIIYFYYSDFTKN